MHDNSSWFRDTGEQRLSADEVTDLLADRGVVVVSNRQPFAHNDDGDEVCVDVAHGGLVSGLNPFLRASGGTWVAWGDGDADRTVVDGNDCVRVPPDDPSYTLRRVWLTEENVRGYYYGFSNRVLWPLFHASLGNVHAEQGDWHEYRAVNRTFADAVVEEAAGFDAPIVWFQDYHLALAPGVVRERLDDAVLSHFWHVPWPDWDVYRACPHGRTLLRGLLANDVVGFHVDRYRANFLSCVDRALDGAVVDHGRGTVRFDGHTTTVGAHPLGVDVDGIAAADDRGNNWTAFADRHGIDPDTTLALGVERLDYTKGIPERLRALELFWETNPEWRGELTYVQKATESRSLIPEYDALQTEVASTVDRINDRFGTDDWTPVVYTTEWLDTEEIYDLYRRADLALVSPLRDGMNLVASEFVAAQGEDPGVLVLSDQAGAHDRLGQRAVSVSPHEVDEFASAIETAVTMSPRERRERMNRLQIRVRSESLSNWVRTFVTAAEAVERRPPAIGHREH